MVGGSCTDDEDDDGIGGGGCDVNEILPFQ